MAQFVTPPNVTAQNLQKWMDDSVTYINRFSKEHFKRLPRKWKMKRFTKRNTKAKRKSMKWLQKVITMQINHTLLTDMMMRTCNKSLKSGMLTYDDEQVKASFDFHPKAEIVLSKDKQERLAEMMYRQGIEGIRIEVKNPLLFIPQ